MILTNISESIFVDISLSNIIANITFEKACFLFKENNKKNRRNRNSRGHNEVCYEINTVKPIFILSQRFNDKTSHIYFFATFLKHYF